MQVGLPLTDSATGKTLTIATVETMSTTAGIQLPNVSGVAVNENDVNNLTSTSLSNLNNGVNEIQNIINSGTNINKPILEALSAIGIMRDTAIISGRIADFKDAGNSTSEVRLAYKPMSSETWTYSAWVAKSDNSEHSLNITGLTPVTSYEYKLQVRDLARPSVGIFESNIQTFLTIDATTDIDSIINVQGNTTGNGVLAFDATTVTTLLDAEIVDNKAVGLTALATLSTKEFSQQDGQSNFSDILLRAGGYPAKFNLNNGQTFPKQNLVLNSKIDGLLTNNSKLLVGNGMNAELFNIDPAGSITVEELSGLDSFATKYYDSSKTTYIRAFASNGITHIAVSEGPGIYVSTDGETWVPKANTITNHLLGIAYGNGLFTAIGENGICYTSPDGNTWTSRTSSFGATVIFDIAYGNGKFVAVGDAGKLATSPDGITWTQRTSGMGSLTILTVQYVNGVFFATGSNGTMVKSTDGVTWSGVTTTFTTGEYILSVIYDGSKYIACGSLSKIMVSKDGVAWNGLINNFGGNDHTFYGIYYLNGIYLAHSNGFVRVSEDLVNWKSINTPFNISGSIYRIKGMVLNNKIYLGGVGHRIISGMPGIFNNNYNGIKKINSFGTKGIYSGTTEFRRIVHANGIYVIVGYDGIIMRSTDGINWNAVYSNFKYHISDVIYANGMFIALCYRYGILTSTDGFTWTNIGSYFGSEAMRDITYNAGLYIAIGAGTGLLYTSTNLTTWTQRTSQFSGSGIYTILYNNGLYIIGGNDGKLATSTDGINWTLRTSSFGAYPIYKIAFANGLYVAVGYGGKLVTSPDGITWTQRTSGFGSYNINTVFYANDRFVAAGDNGIVTTSNDGITWTQRTSGFGTYSIKAGAYISGKTYLVGYNNIIATSTDNVTWVSKMLASADNTVSVRVVRYINKKHILGNTDGSISVLDRTISNSAWTKIPTGLSAIYGLTYGNGKYIASGDASGKVAISTDLINWTLVSTGFSTNVGYTVKYLNNQFILVGQNGKIATSPDGVTWTLRTSGITNWLSDIAYGNGLYVAVANSGVLITSPDGITWTSRTSSFGTTTINVVEYSNNMFMIAGDTGKMATSSDGIIWTQHLTGFNGYHIQAICVYDNAFILAGSKGMITTWRSDSNYSLRYSEVGDYTIYGIAYGDGVFIASGANSQTMLEYPEYTYHCPVIETVTIEPEAVYNGDQKLYTSATLTAGEINYVEETIDTISRSGDYVEFATTKRAIDGRHIRIKADFGETDKFSRIYAELYA